MLTNNLVFLFTALLVAGCSATSPRPSMSVTQHGNVTNFETPGNLKSLKPVNCVPISALSRTNTPADVFIGVSKCTERSDYQSAVALYSVAGVYGTFDKLRVRDQSAHEAIQVLRLNFANSLNEQQKAAFGDALKHVFGDTQAHGQLCASLIALGPPDYFPTYMVQHGMNAFTGGTSGGELEQNFDAQSAWAKALNSAARCKIGT